APGVAGASSISAVIVAVYSLSLVARQFGMQFAELVMPLAAPVLAATGMGLVTLALASGFPPDRHAEPVGLLLLALYGLFAAVLYVALLALLRPSDARRVVQALRDRPRGSFVRSP